MIKKVLTFILIIVLCIFVYGCSEPTNRNVETIIDVTQYFRITPERLIELLGEPKEIEEIILL